MGHVLLAAKITIYVSGLIVFHQNTKTLDVLFLKGDDAFDHHGVSMEPHRPYLTISADDLDLGPGRSIGYEIVGGAGPAQLARFPLSGKITLKGALSGKVDLDGSCLPVIGKGGSCEKPLYQDIAHEEWPIEARLTLKNAVVKPVADYITKVVYHGTGCPKTEPDEYPEIAERVLIEVTLSGTDAAFQWKKGNTRATLKLKAGADQEISAGVANLPEKGHVVGPMSSMAHDFPAYYSVLENQDGCTCVPERYQGRGSQPIFCPPSRTPKP